MPLNKQKSTCEVFLEKACKNLKYDDSVFQLLMKPSREIIINIPITRDDGKITVFTAFRVQHHDARGPYKGGLRYHPEVNLEEVKSLATLMSLKTALVNIPLGGAKGGITLDPKQLSNRELERVTRKFVEKIHMNMGVSRDIPAPDMGTNAQTMAWIHDEYSRIYGHTSGVVTGKPLVLGGSEGREQATGQGVAITMKHYAKHYDIDLENKTVAIQGFGNLGTHLAKFLQHMGMKIIAMSDSKGGVYNEKGYNAYDAITYKEKNGSLVGLKGTTPLKPQEVLEVKCDFLIPAALGSTISKENANKIKAKYIFEGANNPITHEANKILLKKNKIIIPDILANSGGVIVSYFEWVQNIQQMAWKKKEIEDRLSGIMIEACERVFNTVDTSKLNFRDAAYLIATERLKEAIFAAGI